MNRIVSAVGLLLITFIITACGAGTNIFNNAVESVNGPGEILFGPGTFDEGITTYQSVFTENDDFLLDVTLNEPFGTSDVKFIILKSNSDGSEEFYVEWSDTVDPTWNSLVYEFQVVDRDGKFEIGDYIVRIFADGSDLVAEGTFSIS
ncbi:hypothetical protein [Radiobacillus sp. PE A8.2]|uniref:hypothetical protein n=1 Tax=Radiobacillus sp. PE A8.2 TaxID=3380349 RepID=UPI00388D1286